MKTKSFTDLNVWHKTHQFVLKVYSLTKTFPKSEMFGLTSQFRRAAISIAANICEGYKKLGKKDKIRFFNISPGSLEECRYFVILSKDLGYCNKTDLLDNLEEISKMLESYLTKIKGEIRS